MSNSGATPARDFVVGVMFGGRSSEHDISIKSACFAVKNINKNYKILLIGISQSGELFSPQGTFSPNELAQITVADLTTLTRGHTTEALHHRPVTACTVLPLPTSANFPDTPTSLRVLNREVHCFFPVLHGSNGEDGRWQGLFELAEIPYTGCDLRASVLGIDKDIQKRLARDAGVSIAKYICISKASWTANPQETLQTLGASLGYPCFVKPNALGSAVGAGIARNPEQLINLLNNAAAFDEKILVEELMHGSEVECAFMGSCERPLISDVAGEIITQEFYSYEEKYSDTSQAVLRLPAELSLEQTATLRDLALRVSQALGLYGLARIDFWHTTDDRFVFNEVNTLPGMTAISMFPKLMEYQGVPAETWIQQLIEGACLRQSRQASPT